MAGVTSLLGKSPGSERNQEHAEGALDDGMTASGVADPAAREFLPKADPILARVIDAHPGFRPRAWMDDLPPLDAFGTLIFQVVGQQLSVASTRAIVSRIEELFGGRMPTPAELLATDPQVLLSAGLAARKGATIRALAERTTRS